MKSTRIQQIELYVKQTVAEAGTYDLLIAHDYNHTDRVRNWALRIAEGESYPDLPMVEAAALLHDIGLTRLVQRTSHGHVSAEMAAAFLGKHRLFSENDITIIAQAIATHDTLRGDGGKLGAILRDADMMDMFGAVGVLRGSMSRYDMQEYDPANVRGETWGLSADDFTRRFREGTGKGRYVVDQLNFHISCYDNLNTTTARQLAKPLVDFERAFVDQLAREVEQTL